MKVTRLISSSALLAALFVLVAPPMAAQELVPAVQQAPTGSASVSAPSTLPGPRLTAEFQRAEPTLAPTTTAATAAGQHTIVISTLVLVLAVIIIVLLVAK